MPEHAVVPVIGETSQVVVLRGWRERCGRVGPFKLEEVERVDATAGCSNFPGTREVAGSLAVSEVDFG